MTTVAASNATRIRKCFSRNVRGCRNKCCAALLTTARSAGRAVILSADGCAAADEAEGASTGVAPDGTFATFVVPDLGGTGETCDARLCVGGGVGETSLTRLAVGAARFATGSFTVGTLAARLFSTGAFAACPLVVGSSLT